LFKRFDQEEIRSLGEVVDGMDLVKKIESYGSQSGNPKAKVVITKCGTVE